MLELIENLTRDDINKLIASELDSALTKFLVFTRNRYPIEKGMVGSQTSTLRVRSTKRNES